MFRLLATVFLGILLPQLFATAFCQAVPRAIPADTAQVRQLLAHAQSHYGHLPDSALYWARLALAQCPPNAISLKAECHAILGAIFEEKALVDSAASNYYSAAQKHAQAGAYHKQAHLLAQASYPMLVDGRLPQALQFLNAAITVAEQYRATEVLAKAYARKSYVLQEQGHFAEATQLAHLALNAQRQGHDSTQMAYSFYSLGYLYDLQGQYIPARHWFTQALGYHQALGNTQFVAQLQNNLGSLWLNQGRYDSALRYYVASAITKESLGNSLDLAIAYNNIGITYHHQSRWPEAQRYFQRALALHKQLEEPIYKAEIQSHLAEALGGSGNYVQAFALLDSCARVFTQMNAQDKLGNTYMVRGNLHLQQQQYARALQQYQAVLTLGNQVADQRTLLNTHTNRGVCHAALGEYMPAKEAFEQARLLALAMGNMPQLARVLQQLASAYNALGHPQKAFNLLQAHNLLQDSLDQLQRNQQVAEMQERYNTVVQQKEIDNLEAQNVLNTEKARRRTQQRNAILAIGSLLLLLSLVFLRSYRQKQRLQAMKLEQRETAHQNRVTQLLGNMRQAKAQALLNGQEHERKRIAQDLHDRLGGLMVALQMQVGKLPKAKGEQAIKETTAQAQAIIQEAGQSVRAIAHNMATGNLQHFGLVTALEQMAAGLSQSGYLQLEFISHGLEERLPAALELDLYQAIQELIGNAIKHGQASEITLQLLLQGSSLTLMVEDNGKGFNVEAMQMAGKGLGLSGLYDRMGRWKATVELDSTPNYGTTVSIILPLSEEHSKQPYPAVSASHN